MAHHHVLPSWSLIQVSIHSRQRSCGRHTIAPSRRFMTEALTAFGAPLPDGWPLWCRRENAIPIVCVTKRSLRYAFYRSEGL